MEVETFPVPEWGQVGIEFIILKNNYCCNFNALWERVMGTRTKRHFSFDVVAPASVGPVVRVRVRGRWAESRVCDKWGWA